MANSTYSSALIDDDLVLFESMAINLYLAKTYGGSLYPDNSADEARQTN